MNQFDFSFTEITEVASHAANYTNGCSGDRSDCCTRVCTRNDNSSDSLDSWDKYLEVNAGVVQY